jgi:hypothetical protein
VYGLSNVQLKYMVMLMIWSTPMKMKCPIVLWLKHHLIILWVGLYA